jgi:cytochrome c-type biogenesis protein
MTTYYGLGFLAGILSLLAPCVLPLIPIVLGSSSKSTKWGPLANALGLTFSFTIFGILTSLFAQLFDVNIIQKIGAAILVVVGIVLLFPRLKFLLSRCLNPMAQKGFEVQGKIQGSSIWTEFLMGSVLGMVWGPCSGPTLAFAFGLATQSSEWIQASIIFFCFGLGAGLGLITLGYALKKFTGLTSKILGKELLINRVTGTLSIILGLMIIMNFMSAFEAFMLDLLPEWIVNLSTVI